MNGRSMLVTFLLPIVFLTIQIEATDDKFIKRYAVMKMYESCFGEEVVKEIRKEMKMAATKCHIAPAQPANVVTKTPMAFVLQQHKHQQADSPYSPELLKSQTSQSIDLNKLQEIILAGFRKQTPSSTIYTNNNIGSPLPYSHAKPWTFFSPSSPMSYSHGGGFSPGPFPVAYGTPYFNPLNPFHQSAFFSPLYGAGRSSKDLDLRGQLESVAARISGRFKNITCIMQELGYLDNNLEPDFESIMNRIKMLAIPNELKSDMIDAVQYCKQFSMCIPDEGKDKLSKEMVRPIFFFRCYKHKKMEACILKDIKDRYTSNENEDNILGYKRIDRSSHEVNSKEVAELTSYEFLFGDDYADFETF